MTNKTVAQPPVIWLEFVKKVVRLDPTTGELFLTKTLSNRVAGTKLGCRDKNGYIKVAINGRSVYAHQIVFFLDKGYWPRSLLDHKDRDPGNNRPNNLVESSHSENALNSGNWITSSTGVKGASLTPYGKYKVTRQGKYLGTFESLKDAANAYNQYS